MDYDELFPGRFLKSGLFKGREVTLTLKAIRMEKLPQDKGGEKAKPVLSFREVERELVLNRTNAECIRGMFGRNTDDWMGKRVTFWPAPYRDNMTGEETTAIRVRGSPDLAKDMDVEIRLPRKKPVSMKMSKTTGRVTKAPVQVVPPPEPEADPFGGPDSPDPLTGEVSFGPEGTP